MASRRIICFSLLYSHRRQVASNNLFNSKSRDLMTSISRKWSSSNSPSASHPRYNMNVEQSAQPESAIGPSPSFRAEPGLHIAKLSSMAGTSDNSLATAQAFVNATEKSWNKKFIGPGASALWEHIMHYYWPWSKYAPYVAMIQSSGMGKSRTIDELSKTRFTIPLCLRPPHTIGYPRADDEVRDFLTEPQNERDAHLHTMAFLLALFEHTETTLRSEFHTKREYGDVAASFRQHMISSKNPSQRWAFFHTVVANAKKYVYECSPSRTAGSTIQASFLLKGENMVYRVHSAWTSLASLLETKYRSPKEGPILLIAWDDAHALTKRVNAHSSWSHFIALRRVLDELVKYPIFSIFASTTSKISESHFPPASVCDDVSNWAFNRVLELMPPFCDFGFDLLVTKKVSLDEGQTLDEFTSDDYMCHLGRPSFGSQYNYGNPNVRNDLFEFASGKLVNHLPIPLPSELSPVQKIACLSSRLPIQFNSTSYSDESLLVASHMRMCIKFDPSRECYTFSASEPFISEAAYSITNQRSLAEGRRVAVETFRQLTAESFAIHSSDRGEFLALLLCTLARDSTVGMPGVKGHPSSRHFGLAKFLCDNLIHDTLASDESKANLQLLRSDFPHAVLHFNHFINVHEESVITQEKLLLVMARGAGFLCANCLSEVDFILPFLVDGLEMATNNGGLILAKATNDSKYGADIQEYLFEHMNPNELLILENDQVAVPMIRIVFALASAMPSVQVIRREPSDEYKAIIYDIWVAGITPDVLRPVDSDLQDAWEAVLHASRGWKHATGLDVKNIYM